MSADTTKQAAQALSASFEEVLSAYPDGVVVFDRDFRILYANARARAISRLTSADINTRTHWEIFPETVGTIVQSAYDDVMHNRVERTLPDFFYEPFRLWVRVRAVPVASGIAIIYRDVTAEVEAADKQRTLEDRVRVTLQAANGVGIWDWDIVADRVQADVRFCQLYGVDPKAAAVGAPIADFTRNIHPDDMERIGALINAAMQTGEFDAQYRIVQRDGTIRWVATRGSVLFDDTGVPVRLPGVALDITEQKEREEALRVSEERYRVLTELNPQSLWTANPQGLVLYANQRFLEYIGKEFVPRTGTEYIECFDPEDRQRVVDVWTHSVVTGEDYDIRARLIRGSDGASRWWHVWASPVRDADGVLQQWLGLATDIHDDQLAQTQLHTQYAELERQRRELQAIYHTSPIGMALYEPKELRLLRINQRQCELFAINPVDAIGKTVFELIPHETRRHEFMRRASLGESMLNQRVESPHPDVPGSLRYFEVNYSPVFAEDGTVQAVAGACTEVTHQRLAEQALLQSEKLAAVGRMASSIAHEINNPLESVMNLIFLARSYAVNPDAQNFLDQADQELRRVSIIANQTLRFHKQASNPRDISCSDLFSTVLSLYEGRLKNSAIKVEKLKRAGRPICCFEGDIRQVLNNLVGNAIDAMPTGGCLFLRSRESTDWATGRKGLTLTVADTGSGMSTETQAHIFEAFFTTKGISGTGLGLWISADITARHGGRLRLRSSQGVPHRGTVFMLFLPFDPTPLAQA